MLDQAYKRYIAILVMSFFSITGYSQKEKDLYSPDSLVKVHLAFSTKCTYAVTYNGQALMQPSIIDMELADGSRLSNNLKNIRLSSRSVHESIISPVPEKRKIIPDVFNELTIHAGNNFSIVFRAYNDGVAYRIATKFNDSIVVRNEVAEFYFAAKTSAYYPEVKKRGNQDIYHTSFEEPYQYKQLDSISDKTLCFSPVLVVPENGPKVSITESDLEDYPGMFIAGTGSSMLRGDFAPYPRKEAVLKGEYSQVYVAEREDYIAKTKGTRGFPWRVLMIAPQDKDLPSNDLVYRLASPSRLKDVSWVRPGKATDEWIITENLFNVPFKSGVNTATYKYYIDFAKRFGFDRIMMDAGWSDNNDLFAVTASLNMDEIAAYAKQQGVGLSMWTLAMTLDKQLEPALQQFNKWGVDFIMTDFIDRDDQKAVQFYYKIAEACAKHQIMIMFHGAFKPAGFNRTYPHAIAREAVLGSEYNIWSDKANPRHNLLLPFIRMTAGPMDYEPGILDNATEKTFRPIAEKVMSPGTRCQQLAMYVVYESPMQFFAGNPSQGLLEPKFMELLGSIPSVWDTTIVLEGKVGEYIITARRKNNDWYIGAMTDLHDRAFTIPLDFLSDRAYEATICEDGINADRYASDYKLYKRAVSAKDFLSIKMAPGGGFMVKLKAQGN